MQVEYILILFLTLISRSSKALFFSGSENQDMTSLVAKLQSVQRGRDLEIGDVIQQPWSVNRTFITLVACFYLFFSGVELSS